MNWKGGKSVSPGGYSMIRVGMGYIMEHRLVMEKCLGRSLTDTEIVHHINGIKTDNRLQNLELMSRSKHMSHHFLGKHRIERENRICLSCGSNKTYMRKPHGNRKTFAADWHHHPDDKKHWYCSGCYSRFKSYVKNGTQFQL